MKYKITKIVHKKNDKKEELVDLSSLYDFGIFCEKDENKTVPYRKRVSRTRLAFAALAQRLSRFFSAVRARLVQRLAMLRARPENRIMLPALCGALCATLIVAAAAFSVVGYRLVLKNYFGSYKTVTVPGFVGASYPEDEIFTSSDYCSLTVKYEYNNEIPQGVVISQTPKEGVERRVYRKKSNCHAELVVSLGKRVLDMPEFGGMSLRDARLALKNEGVKFRIEKDYSSDIPQGCVISSSPTQGSAFYADDTVTLTVSLGERVVYNTVPSLFGMTESRARALITEAGFTVGEISYESSEHPAGTVISQSRAAGSALGRGEAVSFTVSAGQKFNEKKIPDLYGLSIEKARERLSEVGLVLGNIYAVANAAPRGTVVSQSILAGTPIRSDIYTVDVYVSS